jgi:hypothetical protein
MQAVELSTGRARSPRSAFVVGVRTTGPATENSIPARRVLYLARQVGTELTLPPRYLLLLTAIEAIWSSD